MTSNGSPVEDVTISDTGFHLPQRRGSGSVDGGVDAAALVGSLLSLPPRAHKRRRGQGGQAENAEKDQRRGSDGTDEQAVAAKRQVADGSVSATGAAASSQPVPPPPPPSDAGWVQKFEYRDHTADIQLHSWGDSLPEALEQVILAMFAYMTDLNKVDIDHPAHTQTIEVEGHDMDSLLFALLDEFLFRFLTNEWVIRRVRVEWIQMGDKRTFRRNESGEVVTINNAPSSTSSSSSSPSSTYRARVTGWGEHFTLDKHTQGTEVKAITYSNMQIYLDGQRVRGDNERSAIQQEDEYMETEEQKTASKQESGEKLYGAEIFVIVDI